MTGVQTCALPICSKRNLSKSCSQPTHKLCIQVKKDLSYWDNRIKWNWERWKLRNYLQKQKSKPSEHSRRLRRSKRSVLRGKGKCTRVFLQEVNKVLNWWRWVKQGTVSKPGAVCKDVSTCFHLAMATRTLGALCREKALSILPNGSMVKDGSSCPGT